MIYIDTARKQVEAKVLHLAESASLDVRIKKQALTALSAIAALFAVGVLSMTIMGAVYPTISLISLPFCCFSWVLYQTIDRLKDYDDPFELQIMRGEARRMSFSELVYEHQGIDSILQHKIVEPAFLRSKFLVECEGKALSALLKEMSFSYMEKYKLMTKEQMRNFFILELQTANSITNLLDCYGEFGFRDLKRLEVISFFEHEDLERLHAEEERIEDWKRTTLLQLDTQFFARRENLVLDLQVREKKKKEELQNIILQERTIPLQTLHSLQKQLKDLQKELARIEQDETIGKALQTEYDIRKEEIYREYREKNLKISEELQIIKNRFLTC